MATDSSPPSSTLNTSTLTLIILTALLALGGGIYLSGAGDSIGKYLAEQFFRGKATAEKKALEHVGEEKARGFLKDQLKKNPVVSNEELNMVQKGLGDEAAREVGEGKLKGGVGGMAKGIGKAFD